MYVGNLDTRDVAQQRSSTGVVGAATTIQAGGFYAFANGLDTVVAAANSAGQRPGGFADELSEGKTTGDTVVLFWGHTQKVKFTWAAGDLGSILYASGANTFTTTAGTGTTPVGRICKLIDADTVLVAVTLYAS